MKRLLATGIWLILTAVLYASGLLNFDFSQKQDTEKLPGTEQLVIFSYDDSLRSWSDGDGSFRYFHIDREDGSKPAGIPPHLEILPVEEHKAAGHKPPAPYCDTLLGGHSAPEESDLWGIILHQNRNKAYKILTPTLRSNSGPGGEANWQVEITSIKKSRRQGLLQDCSHVPAP